MTSDTRADIRDLDAMAAAMAAAQPSVVLHLAAQPLVRDSYRAPVETLDTNVMGTAHLLEAVRRVESVKSVVVVTTDKVYQNRDWSYPYRESDALGGADPYSASKAAAEIVTASYRASFFGPGRHTARIATARAGNVIGGGDWAFERLVPDCLRAADADAPVELRFPEAVRPWQHVLEPLSGYVRLAEALLQDDGAAFAESWNFGPDLSGDATVGAVAEAVSKLAGSPGMKVTGEPGAFHETKTLRLESSRARFDLGWTPRWSLGEALERTVEWHKAWRAGDDMQEFTRTQLASYLGGPAEAASPR
jgi:CDP-glucose 4,6-dehydratase